MLKENLDLQDFSLRIGDKILFDKVNITFKSNSVNHILGNNGCGKTSFAKSCVGILPYEGIIEGDERITFIGSSSNVPNDFCINDITDILIKRFDKDKVSKLYRLLKLENIPQTLKICKMSDGQKQKIKLLSFLSANNKIIVLDEFTNALDKISSLDLYDFINEYIKLYDVIIINITHNLTDLEYIPGSYFHISDKNICKIDSKQEIINKYIMGE